MKGLNFRNFCVLLVGMAIPSTLHAQIMVLGSLTDDRDAVPGMQYTGVIQVKNETDEPQEAKIFLADYLFYHGGSNHFNAPGSSPRSNADWVQFTPAQFTIPPGELLPVQYVVTVPEQSDVEPLSGTYWSILMVEPIAKGSAESSMADGKPQLGVVQVTRYGVQIATHLGDIGERAIVFEGVDVIEDPKGNQLLQINVANQGETMIRPDVWIELYDPSGEMIKRFEGSVFRIYPGTSVRQRIQLEMVPSGTYEALIVVDAGEEDIFGTQYTLRL